MAITLGGIVLSPHLQWSDRHKHSSAKQSVIRTLGGGLAITAYQTFAGRPITLNATRDQGWLLKGQVDSIQTMSDVVGATYTLNIHGDIFTVMFAHHTPPAFEATPLLTKQIYTATDYYTATIKLLTI